MEKADLLYNLFNNQIPFSFIKMNDGECAAINDITAVLSRGDDQSSPLMSEKLKEALNYEASNYFVGIPCQVCRGNDYNIAMKYINSTNYPSKFLSANVLINSNYWKTFQIFKNNQDRNYFLVTNERNAKNIHKLPFKPYKTIIVSEKNAFEKDYGRVIKETPNNKDVVICLCGPLGRVLCYEWYRDNPTLTCLELGSLFDPFLKNKTYLYHTFNHHLCPGCFPTNEMSLEQNEFVMKLIEDPEMENECFYSWNNENVNYYTGLFRGDYTSMKMNTLIRIKKNPHDTFMRFLLLRILHEEMVKKYNVQSTEGYTLENENQTKFLIELVRKYNPETIIEIGFGVGHSSLLFLNNTNAKVISFENGNNPSIDSAKKFIDEKFPYRHKLLKGDSTITIPEFSELMKNKYDMIFIDGGHNDDIPYKDIINCEKLAGDNTILIVNDIVNNNDKVASWNINVTRIWNEVLEKNIVNKLGWEDIDWGRGIGWGTYNKNKQSTQPIEINEYKESIRNDLFNKIRDAYFNQKPTKSKELGEFYLEKFYENKYEYRFIKFIVAASHNDNETKRKLYVELLNDPFCENDIKSWSQYNLNL